MATAQGRIVNCPFCRKPTVYSQTNAFRPFCSERCKNEDVIAWTEERYRIATDNPDEDQEDKDSDEAP